MSPQEKLLDERGTTRSLPVTVSITRTVHPDNIPRVTRWVQEGVNLANRYPGFLGSGWVRGTADGHEWHMLYRFSSDDSLDAWERSDHRAAWLDAGRDLVIHQRTEKRTGIEGWFDAPQPGESIVVPPRWKQTVAVWLAFFPVNAAFTYVASFLWPAYGTLPIWLKCLISTMVLCPIMVPFVLPLVTRWLGPWLTAPAREGSGGDCA